MWVSSVRNYKNVDYNTVGLRAVSARLQARKRKQQQQKEQQHPQNIKHELHSQTGATTDNNVKSENIFDKIEQMQVDGDHPSAESGGEKCQATEKEGCQEGQTVEDKSHDASTADQKTDEKMEVDEASGRSEAKETLKTELLKDSQVKGQASSVIKTESMSKDGEMTEESETCIPCAAADTVQDDGVINVTTSLLKRTNYPLCIKPLSKMDGLLERRVRQAEFEEKQRMAIEQVIAKHKAMVAERDRALKEGELKDPKNNSSVKARQNAYVCYSASCRAVDTKHSCYSVSCHKHPANKDAETSKTEDSKEIVLNEVPSNEDEDDDEMAADEKDEHTDEDEKIDVEATTPQKSKDNLPNGVASDKEESASMTDKTQSQKVQEAMKGEASTAPTKTTTSSSLLSNTSSSTSSASLLNPSSSSVTTSSTSLSSSTSNTENSTEIKSENTSSSSSSSSTVTTSISSKSVTTTTAGGKSQASTTGPAGKPSTIIVRSTTATKDTKIVQSATSSNLITVTMSTAAGVQNKLQMTPEQLQAKLPPIRNTTGKIKLARFSKPNKKKQLSKKGALPCCQKFQTKSKKRSLFVLEKSELRKMARNRGVKEATGFNYNCKMNNVNWPYPCPRPHFKTAWRYRTQTLKTFAAASLQLRILWACIRWDDINVKPPAGGTNTVSTESEITTTELLKRRDVGSFSLRSEFLVRKIIVPIGVSAQPKGKCCLFVIS